MVLTSGQTPPSAAFTALRGLSSTFEVLFLRCVPSALTLPASRLMQLVGWACLVSAPVRFPWREGLLGRRRCPWGLDRWDASRCTLAAPPLLWVSARGPLVPPEPLLRCRRGHPRQRRKPRK
eukprot:6488824-Amphidinium_carterae.1